MSGDRTHWKLLTNPDYLGAYSLQPNQELTVEIVRVERKQITGSDGKKEECTVMVLKDQKPMILNATNAKILSKVYGTPYVEEWQGKSVVIYAAKIKAFGEDMEALRIKPTKPPLPELTPAHPKWDEAVKAIKADPKAIDKITARFSVSSDNLKLIQQ